MVYQVKTESYNEGVVYASVTEIAKYVRSLLKEAFPKVKFSVVSDKYAGGSSIRVSFSKQDIENPRAVRDLVDHLHGRGFDGMIDMAYGLKHYLLEDGSIVYAGTGGTEGSRGTVPAYVQDKPAGATELRLGNSYIFCTADSTTI